MRFPDPPTNRPLANVGNINAERVLRISDNVSRGMSFSTACKLEYVQNERNFWRRQAEVDPFWAWASECVDHAESYCIGRVELALNEIAVEKDEDGSFNKDAIKAQSLILKKRSEMYQETPQAREGVGVSITIDKIQLLLQGSLTPSALVSAAFPALPDNSVIDVIEEPPAEDDEEKEDEEDEEDGERVERAPTRTTTAPPSGRAFAFRRKGAP